MELFVEILNGFQQETIFSKNFILDVPLGSEYTSVIDYLFEIMLNFSYAPRRLLCEGRYVSHFYTIYAQFILIS